MISLEQSGLASLRGNSTWRTVRQSQSRSPSPPPPPPPPLDTSLIIPSNLANDPLSGPSAAKLSRGNQGKGPFPFLKRNSRKEPSALNKKPKSPSSTGQDTSEWISSPAKSAVEKPKKGKATKASGFASTKNADLDYWGVEVAIPENKAPPTQQTVKILAAANKSSVPAPAANNFGEDSFLLDLDSNAIARPQQTLVKQEDLDEFAQLESAMTQQTAGTSKPTQSALANTLLGSGANKSFSTLLASGKSQRGDYSLVKTLAAVGTRGSGGGRFYDSDEDGDPVQGNRNPVDQGHTANESMAIRPSAIVSTTVAAQIQPETEVFRLDDDDEDLYPLYSHPDTAASAHHSGRGAPATQQQDHRSHQQQSISTMYTTSGGRDNAPVQQLLRPTSTLKVESAVPPQPRGRSSTPNRRNSSHPQRRSNSASGGRGRGSNGNDANLSGQGNSSSANAGWSKEMADKLHNLETELETYKTENATLKKLKRQQEAALAETLQKRDEVMRYCEDQRLRTQTWCDEQRAAIERERRSVAKQVRETKQQVLGTTAPIKTQKAEIEALQATIAANKAAHDAAAKKWKVTENRLYSLIHEHSDHIENLEKQLVAAETQKLSLLEFIAQSGLRLPKALRTAASSSSNHTGTASSVVPTSSPLLQKLASQREATAFRGYVEEVDVQEIQRGVTTSRNAPVRTTSTTTGMSGSNSNNAHDPGATLNRSRSHDAGGRPPPTSSSTTASHHTKPEVLMPPKSSAATTNKTDRSSSSSLYSHAQQQPSSMTMLSRTAATTASLQASISSWARSSRSSGRYSNQTQDEDEDEDREGYDDDAHHDGDGNDYFPHNHHKNKGNVGEGDQAGRRHQQVEVEEKRMGDDDDDSYLHATHNHLKTHHQLPTHRPPSSHVSSSASTSHAVNMQLHASLAQPSTQQIHGPSTGPSLHPPSQQKQQRSAIDAVFDDLLLEDSRNRQQLTTQASNANVLSGHNDSNNTGFNQINGTVSSSSTTVVANHLDNQSKSLNSPQNQQASKDKDSNRTEEVRADGSRLIHYRNGTTKEIDPQGHQLVRFTNGDTKYTDAVTGAVVYYYAENQTTHTSYVDGVEVFAFPNGQVERHLPSGAKEVTFADGTRKLLAVDGTQESIFPDGVRLREYPDGRQEVL